MKPNNSVESDRFPKPATAALGTFETVMSMRSGGQTPAISQQLHPKSPRNASNTQTSRDISTREIWVSLVILRLDFSVTLSGQNLQTFGAWLNRLVQIGAKPNKY